MCTIQVANAHNLLGFLQYGEYLNHFVVDGILYGTLGRVPLIVGVYSLFRFNALESVWEKYERSPETVFEANLLNLGEDRYLTAMLLKKG